MRATLVGFFALTFALVAFSPEASADKKKDVQLAKTAFKAGQEFLKMDRFADAVVEFKKAHAIMKDDLVLGQIAMAYEKAGDYQAALAAIEGYREALPKADQASTDELITRYKKAIAEGRSKKLVLPTDKQPPKVVDDDNDDDDNDDDRDSSDADADAPSRKGRFWTWIAAGTAGAMALGALVVGLNAQSKFDELDTTCKPACSQADVDSVKSRALAADVLWGTAAVAAVAAGVMYFIEGRGRSAESKEPSDDDEELAHIQISPMLGGGRVGLGAVIRY